MKWRSTVPQRVVSVSLVAQVSGYIAGMEQAAARTRELGTAAERLAQRRQSIATLSTGLLAIGTVAAAGVALAIKKFADFDQAISDVKAATGETTANMAKLREAALDAGAKTVFSATQAANAIEELGKNGLSTADILNGGLNGALGLATAGQLDVGRAAEIAAISMKQFGLEGSAIPHIADLLAAGAGKAAGDVEDLAQALAQSGLVAHSTGLSIDETTGVLSAFADAGLIGSDAGTSFKTMLQRLTPQSAQASDEMKRLGISAYDASGNFIGAANFAGNLRASLKDLTPEQRNASEAIIFGSDSVRAATVLYDQGQKGIQKYIDQTNDAGYAAKVAAARLDNLKGDVEQLGGSLDTVFIQTGSAANDALRGLVQTVTGLVNAVSDLPGPVLAAGLGLGALVAAVGLVVGGALTVVPKIAAFKLALIELRVAGSAAATGIGTVGVAAVAAVAVFVLYAQRQAKITAGAQEFKDSLDQTTGALTSYSRELVVKKLNEDGVFESAKRAGVSQAELTDAILKGGDAFTKVDKALASTNTFTGIFNGTSISAYNAGESITNLRAEVEKGKEQFKDASKATADNSGELAKLSGTATDATSDIKDLADAINNFGKAQFDVNSTQRDLQASIDDATESLKDNGATLDINTDAGRKNQASLEGIAQSALAAAAAKATQTGVEADAIPVIQEGRDAFVAQAIQLGLTSAAANTYADQLGLIPSNVNTFVAITGTDAAVAQIKRVTDALAAAAPYNRTSVGVKQGINPVFTTSTSKDGKAAGGAIYGPGTGTSDTAGLYRLSNGEHVLTTAEVKAMGGQAAVYSFRRSLNAPTWTPPAAGYANGGAVSTNGSGGGLAVTVNGGVGYDPQSIAREISREQAKANARAGIGRLPVA
jgi:TP901 family phage tail tape measure protein